MNGKLQQLIAALRGGQSQPPQQQPQMPQMGGMAGQAQQGLQNFIPAYKQYQMQTMEAGGQPMPYEQFIQQMQQSQGAR